MTGAFGGGGGGFLLISVTNSSVVERGATSRLLTSVRDQGVPSRHILVTRNVPEDALAALVVQPDLVVPVADRIALSYARNLALAAATDRGWLQDARYVSFPDDDCWYPRGLLRAVAARLDQTDTAGVVVDYRPSAPEEVVDVDTAVSALRRTQVFRLATSNNSFYRAEWFAAGLRFDERLGVGARYGSSEDLDVAIEVARRGPVRYVPHLVVGHPLTPHKVAEYYPGNIAVLAKHARSSWWALAWLVRQLFVGMVWLVQRRLPVRGGLTAVRAAWEMSMRRGRGSCSNR
jgi:hypothetical protein